MNRYAVLPSVVLAVMLGLAPAAHADTHYGGTGLYKQTSPANPAISLIRRDNGTIDARLTLAYSRCRGFANSSAVLRARGKLEGLTFTATGRSRVRGMGTIRVTLKGAVADLNATGEAHVRIAKCRSYKQPFVLRTESAPAGAPAVPAPGTLMQGFSAQTAGGFRMPLSLRVTKGGRVYAFWNAVLKCGRVSWPLLDLTPSRKIAADGTFGGSQTYTIRYRGGWRERYRVTFRGQFLADGVKGTLRARMQLRDGKRSYVPCRLGTTTWAARAT